jgi:4-amino-4-deoxy-L-arabinose transferase-like glycosyltransferase
MIRRLIRQPGFVLALVNFCLGLVWMVVIRPLDAPDEPAHLQAVMQVRTQHILPEVHYAPGNPAGKVISPPSDRDTHAYIMKHLSQLPVNDDYVLIPNESTQPPLYYLVAGSVGHFVPAAPQMVLYVARLVAILFGAATVYFCWLTAREVAPGAPVWAIASAGVVALLPQFCFNSAHASNDSTISLAATGAFYVWIRGLRHPEFDRHLFGAGATLGLALLSKLTAVALIPGLALVVLFRIFHVSPSISGFGNWLERSLRMVVGATAGTLLICAWWFIRNIFTYGEPTGMAVALRFFARRFTKADFTRPGTARDLVRYTLENLWGRFGWNDITLPQNWYHFCNGAALVLTVLSALAGIALLVMWVTTRRSPDVTWQALFVFLVVGLMLFVGYVQFNKTIAYQPQARYFFIMLLPGALLLTGGICALARTRVLRLAVVVIVLVALGLLNTLAILTVHNAGAAIGGVRANATHT